jgi:hypothetical protein
MLFDDFREKAKELAQRSLGIYNGTEFETIPYDPRNISGITSIYFNPTTYPMIPHSQYLDGLREIVRKKKEGIRQNRDRYEFDVLVASQTHYGGVSRAHLSYIDENDAINEIHDPYIIIGSDSAKFCGSIFLKPFYNKNLNMDELARLAHFTLKYIDRFKIDYTIGLEGQLPLVYMNPHNGQINKTPDTLLEEWDCNTNKMLDNFEEQRINKLL